MDQCGWRMGIVVRYGISRICMGLGINQENVTDWWSRVVVNSCKIFDGFFIIRYNVATSKYTI